MPVPAGKKDATLFAVQVLLGIPFFYVLTFAGQEEETEVETGAMCAAFAIALTILTNGLPQFRVIGFVLPLGLYVWYTLRILPGLRVLKHAFRGLSYAEVGRHRGALLAFRRALQLDPTNAPGAGGVLGRALRPRPEQTRARSSDPGARRFRSVPRAGRGPADCGYADAGSTRRGPPADGPDPQSAAGHAAAGGILAGGGPCPLAQLDAAAAELHHLLDPDYYGADNPQRLAVLAQIGSSP